ncbi:MAG: 2-C-methyl-D-erythritol 4-phosphate cytidylyltransferase [Oscillospiraceae bacterium]|nr:2-C-methyl-D-erythritol 4-phosphate cytidylyltransferase [Oscillospiraceae bacterium]
MAGFFRKFFSSQEEKKIPFCSAVVAAAGSSSRMEGKDKFFELLGGTPLLARTLLALEHCQKIDEIVVVTRRDRLLYVSELCRTFGITKAIKVIVGSDSRAKSVLCGLLEVSPQAQLIAIHDGARPFASPGLIASVVERAEEAGAAVPAIELKDTIKIISGGQIESTPSRDSLVAVQTPQVFEAALIKAALQKAVEESWNITDDCGAVERLGMRISLVEGAPENIKLTTPADFAMAEGILTLMEETV